MQCLKEAALLNWVLSLSCPDDALPRCTVCNCLHESPPLGLFLSQIIPNFIVVAYLISSGYSFHWELQFPNFFPCVTGTRFFIYSPSSLKLFNFSPKLLELVLHIREVPGSNFRLETSCPDCDVSLLSFVPPVDAEAMPQERSDRFLSHSFQFIAHKSAHRCTVPSTHLTQAGYQRALIVFWTNPFQTSARKPAVFILRLFMIFLSPSTRVPW
jgi:hypothetical protein